MNTIFWGEETRQHIDFWGQWYTGGRIGFFLPHTGLTCSVFHNLWCSACRKSPNVVFSNAGCLCFMGNYRCCCCSVVVHCYIKSQSKWLSKKTCTALVVISSGDFTKLCTHSQPYCLPYNVGVMTEKYKAPSFPVSYEPYLCEALTAGEKQSSKTTGSSGHQPEPNCPTRHAIPLPRAVDSVRRGWEATWSPIMNPQGLLLPLATGAKTVHPGS